MLKEITMYLGNGSTIDLEVIDNMEVHIGMKPH